MKLTSSILISLTGIFHVWFFVLESFLWNTPFGMKTFKMSKEMAEATKVLAQNQGFYNLFLAAGIFLGLYTGDAKVIYFFLICIIVAGIVGAVTANKNILFVQAVPALLALITYYLASRN